MASPSSSPDDDLALIPRSVRAKLDRVRIKLHLRQWQSLPLMDRQQLRDVPCEQPTEIELYARLVERLLREATGEAPERI